MTTEKRDRSASPPRVSTATRQALIAFFRMLKSEIEGKKISAENVSKALARVEPLCIWAIAINDSSKRHDGGNGRELRKARDKVTDNESPQEIKSNLREW